MTIDLFSSRPLYRHERRRLVRKLPRAMRVPQQPTPFVTTFDARHNADHPRIEREAWGAFLRGRRVAILLKRRRVSVVETRGKGETLTYKTRVRRMAFGLFLHRGDSRGIWEAPLP